MFPIGNRAIGDGHPCFITYEAGATHDGLETAKALASLAAQSGADAVKFQIFDPARLVADKNQLFHYEVLTDRATGRTESFSEPLYDILARRSMPRQDWIALKRHCDSLGIAFFATVGFEEDVELLLELGCHSIKIASSDVNHWPLIRLAARTGMCLQLDTGNATLGEIEKAVDIARAEGNERIVIHNCPSGYPARISSINLNILPTLKRMFGCPVAFSDHTPGRDMDVAAVALGANMLEKTITLDRTTRSVEHVFSLEPNEAKVFVRAIREVEEALGSNRRMLAPEELERRKATRRSAFTRRPVRAGEALDIHTVEFRRPGFGIGPDVLEQLGAPCFSRDMEAGAMIALSDISAGGDAL